MRSEIFDSHADQGPLLNEATRERMSVVNDPQQADKFLDALVAAINDRHAAQAVTAQFRTGAIWQRKGLYTGGSLSPLVSPSPARDSSGDGDALYLSVEVCVEYFEPSSPIGEFVASQRAAEEAAHAAAIEEQIAAKRAAISTGETELGELEAQLARLRRSDAGQ